MYVCIMLHTCILIELVICVRRGVTYNASPLSSVVVLNFHTFNSLVRSESKTLQTLKPLY